MDSSLANSVKFKCDGAFKYASAAIRVVGKDYGGHLVYGLGCLQASSPRQVELAVIHEACSVVSHH